MNMLISLKRGKKTLICIPLTIWTLILRVNSSGVIPEKYEIFLAYELNSTEDIPYLGLVHILVRAKEMTSKLTLHTANIELYNKKIEIKALNNTIIPTREILVDRKKGKVDIFMEHTFQCGEKFNISVPFCGQYKKDYGVILVDYFDNHKKEKLLMTRSSEKSNCLAFPYLGKLKSAQSNFTVNILHRNELTVASDMPLNKTHTHNMMEPFWTTAAMARKFRLKTGDEGMDEWTWDSFIDGGPFYPHQVAWVVSKLKTKVKERTTTHVNTWAQNDSLAKVDYATTVAPKLLTHFESWFKVNTNLTKVDIFAIPDSKARVTVNWGLITVRDKILFYDDQHYSKLDQVKVCVTVAEVLSKLWFGNFITMPAPRDKWLIDALVKYTSMITADAVESTWKFGDLSTIALLKNVLTYDALPVSCPIQYGDDDIEEKEVKLDILLQKKSLLILRMLHRFYGEKVFDDTLETFLKENAHKCTSQEKFWNIYAKIAEGNSTCPQGIKIREIVESWTTQAGYPLIKVNRHYGGETFKVTQERFLSKGGNSRRANGKCWWVPLTIKSGDGKIKMEVISRRDAKKEIQYDIDSHDWLIVNVDYIAPIRVNYDKKNWNLLIEALNGTNSYKNIPVLSRAQLLHDAFVLAIDGRISYNITIRLASYLEHETESVPLLIGLDQLEYINNKLISTEGYGYFAKYMHKIVKPNYERTGKLGTVKTDNRQELQFRAAIVKWACDVGVGECEDTSRTMFNTWMSSPTKNDIPEVFRPTVYCTAIKHGSSQHWDFLFKQLKQTHSVFERTSMLKGLACSREVWTLKRFISWLMCKDSMVSASDLNAALTGLALSPIGNCLAYEAFKNHIQYISKKYACDDSMHEIIEAFITRFNSQSDLDKFLEWQKKNSNYVKKNQQLTQILQFGKIWACWNKEHQSEVTCILRDLVRDKDDEKKIDTSRRSLRNTKIKQEYSQHSEHHAADHEVADHQAADHEAADHQAADHEAADHQAADHEAADHQAADHEAADHQAADHEAADHQAADHEAADHQAADHEAADHQAADHEAADHQAADHEAADHQAADHEAADHQAADHEAADHQAADHEAAENADVETAHDAAAADKAHEVAGEDKIEGEDAAPQSDLTLRKQMDLKDSSYEDYTD